MRTGIRTREGKRAFTLIELLVVIVIISLLAAILFPVFSRARENARRTSCLSNLKQLSLGVLQYQQDFDERFVPTGNNLGTPQDGWAVSLQPYVKSVALYQCPSEFRRPPANPNPYNANHDYTDYYYNSNLDYASGGASIGIPISALKSPANTILHGDGLGNVANYGGSKEILNGSTTALEPRHMEGNTYSFCDGHAKWFNLGVVLAGTDTFPNNKCSPVNSTPTNSNATFCY